MASTYPRPVADLLPAARALTSRLGRVPSRNRLMTELRVGAPKANELLKALRESDPEPATRPEPTEPAGSAGSAGSGAARLHLVPAPHPDTGTAPEQPPQDRPTTPVPPAPANDAPPQSLPQASTVVDPDTPTHPTTTAARRPVRTWPVLLLALPAFVAIWSGWVGLGQMTGFGVVHPLPGIADGFSLNTAITLPVGVETYAAYALRVWLSGTVPTRARRFAMVSAIGSLVLGAAGQVAYHLMAAAHITTAPWLITTAVACLPVAVLGMGAALAHLLHDHHTDTGKEPRR